MRTGLDSSFIIQGLSQSVPVPPSSGARRSVEEARRGFSFVLELGVDTLSPLKPKTQRSTSAVPSSGAPAVASSPRRRRRWLFRFLAVVLAPALVLGLAEVGLRVAGRGYPTRFLLPAHVGDRDVLIENPQFGRQFFPSALARSPAPTVIAARKPAGTFRILLFGESAALGDPRLAFGMGRYLEVLLGERFPTTRFEVVPMAMTAINSHALRLMALEAADYEGDLWIIYAGNNEMVGPFGAATVFGARSPSLAFVRTSLALKRTRLGQALSELAEGWAAPATTNLAWGGLKLFLENQLAPDDPRRQRAADHFENNLEAIVRRGIRAGVPVLLSTVAVNLKDCGPFASLPSSGLAPETQTNFARHLESGHARAAANDWNAACEAYTEAAELDPRYAELQFRLGNCLLHLHRSEEARAAFERACESDALPFRTGTALNNAIRRVGERHRSERVALVECAQELAESVPSQIPGRESFFDHVHPNFGGNYRLARILAEAAVGFLPETVRRDAATDWASPELCDRRLGLSDWNRYAVIETVLRRIADAPYTNQVTSLEDRRFFADQLAELRTRMTPDHYTNTYALYRAALNRRTNDFRLHENFAEYLEAVGHWPGAVAEWQAVRTLVPHHFAAYANLGRALARQGELEEARRNLEIAARLEPRSPEAHLELARVLAQQREWSAAVDRYLRVLRLQPGNARVHVQLADALASSGRRAEAVEMLHRAARLDPGYWEARYLLGLELAISGSLRDAQTEFEAALERRPDHILSRLNLGVVCVRQGKAGPARQQFEEILRLDPNHEKARHYLATLDAMLRQAATPPASKPGSPTNEGVGGP